MRVWHELQALSKAASAWLKDNQTLVAALISALTIRYTTRSQERIKGLEWKRLDADAEKKRKEDAALKEAADAEKETAEAVVIMQDAVDQKLYPARSKSRPRPRPRRRR